MKTDAEIMAAIYAAHDREERYARWLTSKGLPARVTSAGFRETVDDIDGYAGDVDIEVAGYRCQLKVRTRRLADIVGHGWRPLVDEKTKADRTPVDFYILHHPDRVLVARYAPELWGVEKHHDPADRSVKDYYVVDPAYCRSLGEWVDQLRGWTQGSLLDTPPGKA